MNVQQLNEILQTTRKLSTAFNLFKDALRTDKGFEYGDSGGSYAVGTPNPQDQHLYNKHSRQSSILSVDAYYQFIKQVVEEFPDNPFFPKIDEISLKIDKQGRAKPRYTLLKLTPYDTADQETDYELNKYFVGLYLKPDFHDTNKLVIDIVRDAIDENSPDHMQSFRMIENRQLREAVVSVSQFLKNNPRFSLDLHSGNFMVRYTSRGPQLVINDPAHDSGVSINSPFNPMSGREYSWDTQTIGKLPLSKATPMMIESMLAEYLTDEDELAEGIVNVCISTNTNIISHFAEFCNYVRRRKRNEYIAILGENELIKNIRKAFPDFLKVFSQEKNLSRDEFSALLIAIQRGYFGKISTEAVKSASARSRSSVNSNSSNWSF